MLSAPKIIVVSGPPRSGTSLVMQMLVAGGMEAVSDGQRQTDSDNPRGYFEHREVLRLAQDPSILSTSVGKAVKIIHALLKYVPRGTPIAVLFLERDLDEVLASQSIMLERLGRPAPVLSKQQLRNALDKQLAVARHELTQRPEAAVLDIQHRNLVNAPQIVADQIAKFLEPHLGRLLDAQVMADCVDPSLYRQRC